LKGENSIVNPRVVIIVNGNGLETIRIVASSPEEEVQGEALLSKIDAELQALDSRIKADRKD
jgi:hypothetical protein